MLGNWSFGDYYKEEAIAWAWELLTEVWKLPKERLHATVYRTDDEALNIWTKYLPIERIHRFDEKDNFWEMGETGPCGPCSEIHFDRTPDLSGGPLVNAGVPEVIEIWNLVFIQYNRKADGNLEPLASTHVDTGMGFERIVAVIQNKTSNYDSDVFMPIISEIEKLSGKKYSIELTNADGIAMRVIADHIRTLSFAIADGALPGNEGRGYVLRRILRRACRFARNLGFTEPVLYKLLDVLIKVMGDVYQELYQQKETITKVIKGEENSFLQTLDRGLYKIEDIKTSLSESNLTTISGADAFLLYDTFGFPLDLTQLIAREGGFDVDLEEFTSLMAEQKDRSRKARKSTAQEVEIPVIDCESEFVGYDNLEIEAKVVYVNENQIVLDKTPFYTESGGQVSDTGSIILAGNSYQVLDVKKSGSAIIHFCDRDLESLVGDIALAKVDGNRRKNIMRNHSATHLMHEALNRVLGSHIKQAGSLVAPDYLRFDFNHFEKITKEELSKIEVIVNQKILENNIVDTQVLPITEAQKNPKVKMFFGDKYGDVVRVISMDPKYSVELCGGIHVKNTSEIGLFKITSESSIAAGVRRIEAVTGNAVLQYINNLNITVDDKNASIDNLNQQIRNLNKEINDIKTVIAKSEMSSVISKAKNINGINLVVDTIQADSIDQLKDLGDHLRNSLGTSGIGLLATIIDDKVQLVCVVTDDLTKKYQAGKLVGEVAKQLGGGGGGKPHMATAGGKDISKLSEVLANFTGLFE